MECCFNMSRIPLRGVFVFSTLSVLRAVVGSDHCAAGWGCLLSHAEFSWAGQNSNTRGEAATVSDLNVFISLFWSLKINVNEFFQGLHWNQQS